MKRNLLQTTMKNVYQRAEDYLLGASTNHHKASAQEASLLIKELLANQSKLENQISKLTASETEFQKEKEFYKDIFNNQPAGLYRIRAFAPQQRENKSWGDAVNPPYVMEYLSDRFCEILGFSKEALTSNPYALVNQIHPDDKESFIASNVKANKELIPFKWEGRVKVKKSIIWIQLESLPRVLVNKEILWTGILYNITDRKKTEEALAKTRLELEDVLEGANVGTLEWNVQTGKIKFNKIWAKNLGYTNTEIKIGLALLGKKGWRAITHPDDIPYADEMLKKHFSGELPYHNVEVRMRHKKGHWVWIRQEGRVKTWTADGKPLLMYGTHTDISGRKQMEEDLRCSEEKYRILFENNPQPMLIIIPEKLKILEANKAMLNHYGYPNEELRGMSLSDMTQKDDIDNLVAAVEMAKSGNEKLGIIKHMKKDGSLIYVELKAHKIYYNGIQAIHLLMNDITDQKLAEKALFDLNNQLEERITKRTSELVKLNTTLQQNELKFRTLTDFTYDWEYWKSPENKIVFMSPSVKRITGYTVKEFEDDPDLIDKIIHPNDIEIWKKHKNIRCSLETDESKLEINIRILTKSGEIKWLGHVCRCVNINGKCLGIRVSNRDITEKVITDKKLLNITVDVEERERNRFSSELHDGMGPLLSTIKLYFQWLGDTNDPEKKKIIIEKGNHSIEMAIQTARQLAHGLSSQFLSQVGYVHAVNEFTQQINLTKTIQIHFSANRNERFGNFAELMLYRITTELIKNTITYAKATLIEIEFDYDKATNSITFSYIDNGCGFDWHNIKKEKKGLGLMNIQQRVQVMKGDIEIISKPGEGMKASILIPIEENADLSEMKYSQRNSFGTNLKYTPKAE